MSEKVLVLKDEAESCSVSKGSLLLLFILCRNKYPGKQDMAASRKQMAAREREKERERYKYSEKWGKE